MEEDETMTSSSSSSSSDSPSSRKSRAISDVDNRENYIESPRSFSESVAGIPSSTRSETRSSRNTSKFAYNMQSSNNNTSKSPNAYRPRRASAPDLDMIVENVAGLISSSAGNNALQPENDDVRKGRHVLHHGTTLDVLKLSPSPSEGHHTPTSHANAHTSSQAPLSSRSSSSQRSRRHYRQLSAPVIVGGGADADNSQSTSELKLTDGIVITRSGLSTPDARSPVPFGSKRTSAGVIAGTTTAAAMYHQNNGDDEGSENSGSVIIAGGGRRTNTSSPRTTPPLDVDELETLGFLGKGTAGVVTKALHITALRIVAIKAVHMFDATKQDSTIAEIKALHKSQIPFTSGTDGDQGEDTNEASSPPSCIVGFYDAFLPQDGGTVNMVLEWMSGGSLEDLIDSKKSAGLTLPEDFIAVACRGMLHGLCELHDARLLHRDLKPGNVLVSRTGAVKISDFGVSIAFGLGSLSKAQTFVGSLSYMAPERVQGAGSDSEGYSYASDLWGVGLIALVCATGEYPFTKQFDEGGFWGMVQAVNDEVPSLDPNKYSKEIVDFVALCLRKNPKDRPTAKELLAHPFPCRLMDPSKAREAICNQLEPVDLAATRSELNRLLSIAAKAQVKRSLKNQYTIPRFVHDRVKSLGKQLGLELAEDEIDEITESFNSRMITLGSQGKLDSPHSTNSTLSSPRNGGGGAAAAAGHSPAWKRDMKLDIKRR